VLIFIHPQSTPDLAKRLKGNGWLANTIGTRWTPPSRSHI